MSHYDKAIKHSKNHSKDKYYQQCGFSMQSDEPIESAFAIAERTATSYYVGTRDGKRLTDDFTYVDEAVVALNNIRLENPDYNTVDWMRIYTDKSMVLMEE